MCDFTIDLCKKSERDDLIQGEPDRFSYVPYMEAHYKINCSGLSRAGFLTKSQCATIQYYEKFDFFIQFEKSSTDSLNDCITFEYKLNNERFIKQSFDIVWQQRTFGRQPYFVCPYTGKRVKHLFIVEGLIRSRNYFKKMNYYSAHESVQDRHFRAARKIRRKFNKGSELFYPMVHMPKPKNIHQSTWDYWCDKESYHYQQGMNIQAEWIRKKMKIYGLQDGFEDFSDMLDI